MKLSEKEIENQILKWLNLQMGCFAFKVNTVGVYDPIRKVYRKNRNPFLVKGTSDILGVKNGRFFAIEVKTPEGKRKLLGSQKQEPQLLFLETIEKKEGKGLVASSLEEVIEFYLTF